MSTDIDPVCQTKCPRENCKGALIIIQAQTSLEYTTGFDASTKYETFRCDTCSSIFSRGWQWEEEDPEIWENVL